MDLFMPAERVLYDRAYYLSDEAEKDYASEVAEEHGIDVGEAFDGSPVHMSVPVEVGGEKVWTCGYDFCWCETVAPDFSRARGHFPDTIVAAWAAARSANQSDVNLGIKERML